MNPTELKWKIFERTTRDGEEDLCGNIYCRLHDGRFDKDGYCSYGKRDVD